MSRQKQSHVSMRDRAEEPDTNSRHDRNVLLALMGVCVLLLAPLTLVDMPPLMDYPNHLARMYALAFSGHDPVLARFFAPHWAIIPNLALDLVVPPLLWIMPVHVAGRLAIGMTALLPVFGALLYHRALIGRWSFWPLGAALFAYNGVTLFGFLNFQAAVGLALVAAAAWRHWLTRRPALAVVIGAGASTLLFFCHLSGVLMFAILVGAHDLTLLRARMLRWRDLPMRAAVFAIPCVLHAVSGFSQIAGGAEFRPASQKLFAALILFTNYNMSLDLLSAWLCAAILLVCFMRRWCTVPFEGACATAVCLLLFLVLPNRYKGTFDLDIRFAVMAGFIFAASLRRAAMPRAMGWAVGGGFVLLLVVRIGVLSAAWHLWAGELAGFRRVIASVKPGDVVLTVSTPSVRPDQRINPRYLSEGTPTYDHLPALLLIEHRAWWPYMFAVPAQQPIELRPPFRALEEPIRTSSDLFAPIQPGGNGRGIYTHVLVNGGDLAPPGTRSLHRVAASDSAALYEIPADPSPDVKP